MIKVVGDLCGPWHLTTFVINSCIWNTQPIFNGTFLRQGKVSEQIGAKKLVTTSTLDSNCFKIKNIQAIRPNLPI